MAPKILPLKKSLQHIDKGYIIISILQINKLRPRETEASAKNFQWVDGIVEPGTQACEMPNSAGIPLPQCLSWGSLADSFFFLMYLF